LKEGLVFRIWSDENLTVLIRFELSSGPSRSDNVRTVEFKEKDQEEKFAKRYTFDQSAHFKLKTVLKKGVNTLCLSSIDKATISMLPNGDTRHLLVGLHQINIRPLGQISDKSK